MFVLNLVAPSSHFSQVCVRREGSDMLGRYSGTNNIPMSHTLIN